MDTVVCAQPFRVAKALSISQLVWVAVRTLRLNGVEGLLVSRIRIIRLVAALLD